MRATPRPVAALLVAVAVIAGACGSGGTDLSSGTGLSITGGDDAADSSGNAQPDPPVDRVDIQWDTFEGSTKSLTDFPPGPVVLNFFASWCPPCIAELPDFEAVSQAFGAEVRFIGLATTDNPDRALALIADTGVTYQVGADPNGAIFGQMGGFAMPTTVFISADGFVTSVHSGQLSAEALTDKINAELIE